MFGKNFPLTMNTVANGVCITLKEVIIKFMDNHKELVYVDGCSLQYMSQTRNFKILSYFVKLW